jgi:predicted enzyme related to lactoylglutathione lyase
MGMAAFDAYTQGTPSWVELVTPDQRAAAEFYGALFGWQMVENPLDDGHVYIVGSLQGDAVAGITFQLPELAGHPAFWNVFLAADDVDAVAARVGPAGGVVEAEPFDFFDFGRTARIQDPTGARVGPAGGVVEAEPFDFFDYGRTARIQDPTGARVGLWQPRSTWTVRANEPGTPVWNELLTPDVGRASQFYSDVLGVSADTHPVPWATVPTYTTFSAAGRQVAGVAPVADGALEEAPPHWNVYFNVVDADESVAQAEALGAKLSVPAYDLEGTGRMATLTDPHGALFCLMAS